MESLHQNTRALINATLKSYDLILFILSSIINDAEGCGIAKTFKVPNLFQILSNQSDLFHIF